MNLLRAVFGIVMMLVGLSGLLMSACGGYYAIAALADRGGGEMLFFSGAAILVGLGVAWGGWVGTRHLLGGGRPRKGGER